MALFLRIFHAAIDAPDLLGGYHQIADRPFARIPAHAHLQNIPAWEVNYPPKQYPQAVVHMLIIGC